MAIVAYILVGLAFGFIVSKGLSGADGGRLVDHAVAPRRWSA